MLLGSLALAVVFAARATRAERPTLSGRWAASAMQIAWNVGDWGEPCGPKPGGIGAPASIVTILQKGGELQISGAGRSYSTAQCWEQFPGLSRVSHRGGQRSWRTVCKTASGDARQATVITTITATDSYIVFDETGQYQFVLQGHNCTASARRSRSFRLLQRAGEPSPTPPGEAAVRAAPLAQKPHKAAPAQAVRATGACEQPGEPVRLEVRPSRKLMRPGEQFVFRSVVLDAKGCRLNLQPDWRVVEAGTSANLLGPGKVLIGQNAPEDEVALYATVGGHAVKVVVEIASNERYEALLRQRGFNEDGESAQAAVAVISSGSVGAGLSTAQERGRTRRRIFVAVMGVLALLLGGVGLVMAKRSRRQRAQTAGRIAGREGESGDVRDPTPAAMICPTCRREYPSEMASCPVDGDQLITHQERDSFSKPPGSVCPNCGEVFEPKTRICPHHGEELIPTALYAASLQAHPQPTRKVCPVCGSQFGGNVDFCGKDGATLIPVN